jgi:hypothetical protein
MCNLTSAPALQVLGQTLRQPKIRQPSNPKVMQELGQGQELGQELGQEWLE